MFKRIFHLSCQVYVCGAFVVVPYYPFDVCKFCSFFFFLINLFIYLLAALGLRCCERAFCSCGERGLLFVAVCGFLIIVASLCCGAWALRHAGCRSFGTWAQELWLVGSRAQAQ